MLCTFRTVRPGVWEALQGRVSENCVNVIFSLSAMEDVREKGRGLQLPPREGGSAPYCIMGTIGGAKIQMQRHASRQGVALPCEGA